MKNYPKVTIITVTYNLIDAGRKKFFRQCVESVHNQSYGNIEHIVIDGASSDGTLALIKEYANQGWLTYYSEPDNGIYEAMNKGIDLSNGDFINFLNSDDYFTNDDGIKLSVQFLLDTKSDYSFATCQYINKFGKYLGVLDPVIGSFLFRMPFCHQTMLTRKETLLQLDKFDENFTSAADLDFVLRLCLNGSSFVEVPMNFVAYRLTGISSLNQEQSVDESARSIMTNLSQFGTYDFETYKKMYTELLIPKNLYEGIIGHLSIEYMNSLSSLIEKDTEGPGVYYRLSRYPKLASKNPHWKKVLHSLLSNFKKPIA